MTMMMLLGLGRNHGTGKQDHSDNSKQNVAKLHVNPLCARVWSILLARFELTAPCLTSV